MLKDAVINLEIWQFSNIPHFWKSWRDDPHKKHLEVGYRSEIARPLLLLLFFLFLLYLDWRRRGGFLPHAASEKAWLVSISLLLFSYRRLLNEENCFYLFFFCPFVRKIATSLGNWEITRSRRKVSYFEEAINFFKNLKRPQSLPEFASSFSQIRIASRKLISKRAAY